MAKDKVEQALSFLGKKVKDKITGYVGVAVSVAFDLFGCIQMDVREEGKDKDGKLNAGYWFDTNRLLVVDEKPVMELPTWDYVNLPEQKKVVATKNPTHGASEKTSIRA